jgi:hypothetical protein
MRRALAVLALLPAAYAAAFALAIFFYGPTTTPGTWSWHVVWTATAWIFIAALIIAGAWLLAVWGWAQTTTTGGRGDA